MSEEHRDLNQTEQWFRTKLHEYLGYGIAGFSILSGWLHSNDSVISLHHSENAEKHEAAIALAIALPVVWAVWYWLVHSCALAAAVVLFVIWALVADIWTPPAL
jgi:hypothetical protein